MALRLARTRGETATQALALTGRTGKVTVAPVGGQPGKIELIVAGQTEQLLARSADPLRPGDQIIVHRGRGRPAGRADSGREAEAAGPES